MAAGKKLQAELEQQIRELRQQEKALESVHSALCARSRLLTAWTSALSLLKDAGYPHEATSDSQRCLELEQRLQQELAKIPAAAAADRELVPPAASTAVGGGGSQQCRYATISPASDPIAHFRSLLAQPVLPAAASMTSAELAQLQRNVVLEAGVQQQLLQMAAGEAQQEEALLQKIQQIWDRYFHAVLSLYLHGRLHVVEAMAVYNLETLTPDPEGAEQHEPVIESRVHQLQLTPQQQEAITVGGDCYAERMRHIVLQRQQVQSQPAWCCDATAASTTSACFTAAAAAAADGDADMQPAVGRSASPHCGDSMPCDDNELAARVHSFNSGGEQRLQTLRDRQLELEETHRHAERVQQLLEEEAQLRIITWGWLIGCLTWPQVAMLGTICWPSAQRTAVLGRAVHAQWHEQQRQQ